MAASFTFAPTINKAGKITATAEKVAHVLNQGSDDAVLSMALTAKGSIGKQAKAAVINQSGVKTLESMLSSDRVDGGEWSDLLSFLVARFGVAQFSRATMRGKAGCARYLESVALAGKAKYAKAETGKAQASALALLDEINAAMASVIRLQEVAEAERIQAESVAEAERIQAESVAG